MVTLQRSAKTKQLKTISHASNFPYLVELLIKCTIMCQELPPHCMLLGPFWAGPVAKNAIPKMYSNNTYLRIHMQSFFKVEPT